MSVPPNQPPPPFSRPTQATSPPVNPAPLLRGILSQGKITQQQLNNLLQANPNFLANIFNSMAANNQGSAPSQRILPQSNPPSNIQNLAPALQPLQPLQQPPPPPVFPASIQVPPPPPPPPPPKKPQKEEVPKAEITFKQLELNELIKSCGLLPSFAARVDEFRRNNDLSISDGALMLLASAIMLRMKNIVKMSVMASQARVNANSHKKTVYTDVPRANFALLQAEKIIIDNGMNIQREPPKDIQPTFEIFRNRALFGIASRLSDQKREDLTEITKDIDDPNKLDFQAVMEMVEPKKKLQKIVLVNDVYSAIEDDVMFTPPKLRSTHFAYQDRKISELQKGNQAQFF